MTDKNPVGRPSKFSAVDKEQLKTLYLAGWTDNQVADFFHINQDTLNEWKKKYPEFSESLKDWKKQADARVERSLYERACGYTHEAEEVFCTQGDVTRVDTIKHFPPDPTSCIFWLKNRQPKEWREKIDHEHSGNVSVEMFLKDVVRKSKEMP